MSANVAELDTSLQLAHTAQPMELDDAMVVRTHPS